jgi:uncharacterized protein YggE
MKRFFLIPAICLLFNVAHADLASRLSVSGEAIVYKPADRLSLSIGVETYDQDVKKAVQSNAKKMETLRESLLKSGLSETELQTKAYTIVPRHTPTPQNPSLDWQPSIIGYEVKNTLELRSNKLAIAGNVIDAASSAGANIVHSISFSLQDDTQAKSEAIAAAFRRAEVYALSAAKEAGLNLVEIVELTVGQPVMSSSFLKGAATTVASQDVEVSSSVSVVYALEKAMKK